MYEDDVLSCKSSLPICLTKARCSRERCPATALYFILQTYMGDGTNLIVLAMYASHRLKWEKVKNAIICCLIGDI